MACAVEMRTINCRMNTTETYDIKSVQQKVKDSELKETQVNIHDLWKSVLKMRNATEESEKFKLVEDNKMELDTELAAGDDKMELPHQQISNKMEFDKEPEVNDTKVEFDTGPGISRPRYSHRERKQEFEHENQEQAIIATKLKLYEQMLQLGDSETAEMCLSDLRNSIAVVENSSATRLARA